MELHSQQKTLDIQRGLFLIKYESCEDTHHPPRIRVGPDRGSENSIELILPPDSDEAELWSPGASLVARATHAGRLSVEVIPARSQGSTAARVQVVVLQQDPAELKERGSDKAIDLSEFRLLGHVAGRGDVVVDSENWIAGPLAPSRIEGLVIQWPNKPSDLTLRYSVTVGGPRPTIGPVVEAGGFAGTRGRALPLVGATLELSGDAAQGNQLLVEAIFLGSPQMTIAGQRVVLAGSTGREPLVGLKVRIVPVDQPQALGQSVRSPQMRQGEESPEIRTLKEPSAVPFTDRERKHQRASTKASPPAKPSGRVRVFRSQNRKSHG